MAYDLLKRRQVPRDWSIGVEPVYEKRGEKWFKVEEVEAPPETERKEPFKPRIALWPFVLGTAAGLVGLSIYSHRGWHQIHARVARERAMAGT
jgi:hypothetical protein